MPNKRKYTSAKKFSAAVDKYLRSIQTRNDTGQLDLDGKPIVINEFVVPPELRDISAAVGFECYDTWLAYASGKYDDDKNDFSSVCAKAKDVCLRWSLREVNTRIKGTDGIRWNLQVNYGLGGSKHEIELGEGTRKTFEAASLTMEEKMARLAALPEMLRTLEGAESEGVSAEEDSEDE